MHHYASKTRQAVPELLRLLGRFSSSTNTAFQRVEGTLYCLQADEAVPLYLDYISDTRNPHRETVIGVLRQCHLGNNAAAASALLLKCLIGEDHPVAEAAGMALPEFCAPNTVQGLTNIFMTSTNAVIRNRAMWVLGMIGTPEIYSARNVILAGLRDPEEAVRQAATFALGRLEMEPSNAPIVITLLPASGTPAITMPSSAATNTPSNKGLSP